MTTDDGYINLLVKLRSGEDESSKKKGAVLLIHGLIESSDCWVVNTKENSIGFILADAGYDVWMANTRGNKYSNKHARLNPKEDWEYWNRALVPDIAKHDVPSFMEYIIKESNVQNMTVIGHS